MNTKPSPTFLMARPESPLPIAKLISVVLLAVEHSYSPQILSSVDRSKSGEQKVLQTSFNCARAAGLQL